jgi:hypothetical protein
MSDEPRSVIPDFDRMAAKAAGLGSTDYFLPTHDAPPVFPEGVVAVLRRLDRNLARANVTNGSGRSHTTNSNGAGNGAGHGGESASNSTDEE